MSIAPDPRIEKAARDIAEGRNADLEVTPTDTDEIAALIVGLRTVEQVARVHRQMLDSGSEAAVPAAGLRPMFQWGPFDVLEPIGSGSFGEVFRARDATLGRDVALKLRRADEPGGAFAASCWLEEARRLAAVRHPNVVHVYGAAIHAGRAGIWMELVSGVTLARRLESQGSMGWKESCLVGMELCAALAAVHAAGLVHNDVKLENVMRSGSADGGLGGSGRIVLMDLGAGGRMVSGVGDGVAIGTPNATAPEVLLGGAPSVASDLWSLAALLYRLVTGRAPFDAGTAAELIERARRGEVRPLRELRPELPAAFVTAIERALAADPAARFAGAAEFERALARALELPVTEPAARPRPRAWRTFAVAALVLGVMGAVVVAALRGTRSLDSQGTREPAPTATKAGAPATDATTSPPSPTLATPAVAAPVVRARLVRSAASGVETLENGDLVVPGDQLALEVDAEKTMWFYALNEDRSGSVSALFPVAGLDLRNPLPPGHHRLPGPKGGRALDWQVTSTGGDETFLFIASPTRLPEVEERIAASKAAAEGNAVEPGTSGATGEYRGVSGLAPSRAPDSGQTGSLQVLQRDLEHASDPHLWLRRIELRNPGR